MAGANCLSVGVWRLLHAPGANCRCLRAFFRDSNEPGVCRSTGSDVARKTRSFGESAHDAVEDEGEQQIKKGCRRPPGDALYRRPGALLGNVHRPTSAKCRPLVR